MIYEEKKGELELFSYTVQEESLDKLKDELKRIAPSRKFKFVEQPIDTVMKMK